jgi:hypothetical protein
MTSIEWLETELKKIPFVNPIEVFEQAKEMHKKEIIDAIEEDVFHTSDKTAEQYYNKTFNK